MSDDRGKTPRTLLIADHLWEALSAMAAEMGTERDALVNQALYTFARLNGFLLPADLARLAAAAKPGLTDSGRLRIAPAPRVAEVAQQLAASGMPRPVPAAPLEVSEVSPVEVEAGLVDQEVAPTSMELPDIPAPFAAAKSAGPVAVTDDEESAAPRTLILHCDGEELDRVTKERFLIGRGKHCDLVINSGKVSREHAVIVREGSAWFIEDLGSSNGTWFEKRRITRRRIEEGDEYFICSEKLSCSFR